jgi:glycosyltransferase involved in cell wall biosynthesis
LKVLLVTNMWPDKERPWYGTFVHSQAMSLERLGVELTPLPIRGYASRTAYAHAVGQVVKLTRRHRYDLVHAHYGHAGVVGRFQRTCPLVISYCGDDLLGTPDNNGVPTTRSRAEAAAFRQLARVAAATITKSEEMERALPTSCRSRNHVIPNGIDLERLKPIPRRVARDRLGWPEHERTVLFVADPAIPRKNHALAREVCRLASDVVPDLRLRVVNGVAPADIPLAMSAGDALLLTSRWEGSPNVVKEAMALELPVVATAVGDVEERLRGIEGCFACPPRADVLSEALVTAVRHGRIPAARRAISALSLEKVAHRVHAVYDSVL